MTDVNDNPYNAPLGSENAAGDLVQQTKFKIWRDRFTYFAFVLAAIYFAFSAVMLISQTFRLEDDVMNFPPQFRNANTRVVQFSWYLGITSAVLALASIFGLVLVYLNRTRTAWILLAINLIIYVIAAIALRPF